MARIKFTYALKRFFPTLTEIETQAKTVGEALKTAEDHFPGIKSYIVDEHGALRKHVIIFIGSEQISDKEKLSDEIMDNEEIYIFQALSGG